MASFTVFLSLVPRKAPPPQKKSNMCLVCLVTIASLNAPGTTLAPYVCFQKQSYKQSYKTGTNTTSGFVFLHGSVGYGLHKKPQYTTPLRHCKRSQPTSPQKVIYILIKKKRSNINVILVLYRQTICMCACMFIFLNYFVVYSYLRRNQEKKKKKSLCSRTCDRVLIFPDC